MRDDIAEKLADKSEAGLIPRFIKAVNGENTLDNADNAEYNEDDTQYAYNPDNKKRAGWGNGSNYLIRHFSGKINFNYADFYISDQELAIITSSVKSGWGVLSPSKTIGRVYTSEAYYVFVFEPNGSITICDILDLDNSDVIELIETELKNDRTRQGKIITARSWIGVVRNERGRRIDRNNADDSQTGQTGTIDKLDGGSSRSDARGNRNTSIEDNRDKDITDDSSYSYTPKAESKEELLKQYEDGVLTREEYLDLISGKTPKSDPVSLANMHPEDYDMNTTPNVKRKTGAFL